MPAIRGLTVCVGEWYSNLLAITLRLNMRHMVECFVVTTPDDEATKAVARSVPGVHIFETTAFRDHGAAFNKGYALELAFDHMGRHGWIAIWDCDCIWPSDMPFHHVRPDALNGARRRILLDPSRWRPDLNWLTCPQVHDGGPIGFFQLFDASAPAIVGRRPWYDVSFAHAGGSDAHFMELWGHGRMHVLPACMLHLGPNDTNWFGSDAEGRDVMAAYVHRKRWFRAMKRADPNATKRVGEIVERVEVPGYPPSTYRFPLERPRGHRRMK